MKKIVTLLLGFVIGLAAMYWYSNNYLSPHEEEITIAKPKGVITPKQARVLNDNWTNKGQMFLDTLEARPDNRSVWWSTKDIQDYIGYAQNQTDSLGYDMTGLRMYFGRYSKSAPSGNADYATIFIVPTGKMKKTSNTSEGSFAPINLKLQGGGNDDDIDKADPLNAGEGGHPPGTGYDG